MLEWLGCNLHAIIQWESKAIWNIYSHLGSYSTIISVCTAANLLPSGRMPWQVQQSTTLKCAVIRWLTQEPSCRWMRGQRRYQHDSHKPYKVTSLEIEQFVPI